MFARDAAVCSYYSFGRLYIFHVRYTAVNESPTDEGQQLWRLTTASVLFGPPSAVSFRQDILVRGFRYPSPFCSNLCSRESPRKAPRRYITKPHPAQIRRGLAAQEAQLNTEQRIGRSALGAAAVPYLGAADKLILQDGRQPLLLFWQ